MEQYGEVPKIFSGLSAFIPQEHLNANSTRHHHNTDMKINTIIAVILTGLVHALDAQEVTFTPRNTQGQNAQIKIGEEVVWTQRQDPNTSPLNIWFEGYDPYTNCRLLASAKRGDALLVALEFSYDEKTQERIARESKYRSRTFQFWSDKLLFIRRFHRDAGGSWKIALSVFPSTFWADVWDEEVKSVQIENDAEFSVTFKRKWKMEINAGGRKNHKIVVDPAGETKLPFKYDTAHQVLLCGTPRDAKKFVYALDPTWWNDFDEWDMRAGFNPGIAEGFLFKAAKRADDAKFGQLLSRDY